MSKLNRNRGKNTERATAKRLGGQRVGILGGEDVSHDIWSIETKDFARFAGVKIIEQAERHCPEGKTPLAVVHIRHKPRSKDIVMMRMSDFEDWLGKVKEG